MTDLALAEQIDTTTAPARKLTIGDVVQYHGTYADRHGLHVLTAWEGGRWHMVNLATWAPLYYVRPGSFIPTNKVRMERCTVCDGWHTKGRPCARCAELEAAELICDYCDQPATRSVLEAADEVICATCARDQTDGPIDAYARPLTVAQLAHRHALARRRCP